VESTGAAEVDTYLHTIKLDGIEYPISGYTLFESTTIVDTTFEEDSWGNIALRIKVDNTGPYGYGKHSLNLDAIDFITFESRYTTQGDYDVLVYIDSVTPGNELLDLSSVSSSYSEYGIDVSDKTGTRDIFFVVESTGVDASVIEFFNIRYHGSANTSVTGTYTREHDLGSKPIFAKLTFVDESEDSNGTISLFSEQSDDGIVWYNKTSAISGILPLSRYIRITAEFEYDDVPSKVLTLNSYQIAYNISYDSSYIQDYNGNKLRSDYTDDFLYVSDGGRPYKYDGTDIILLGVEPPTAAATLVDSTVAGNPNGDYKGIVTFVDKDGIESNASDESNEVTVASEKINWTGIPVSSDANVTQRKL